MRVQGVGCRREWDEGLSLLPCLGLGSRVEGSRLQGLGFRVIGFRVKGLGLDGFRDLGFRV